MPVLSFDSRSTVSGTNVAVNTWHVYTQGQPLVSEMNTVLGAFKAFYDSLAAYRPTGSTVVTGSRVLYFLENWWTKPTFDANHKLLTKGFFNTEPVIQGATPVTSTAGTGGTQIPPQLASVVSWRTATSGRSGRGRTYLGNLAAAAQQVNIVAAAFVTAANTAATTLISAVNGIQSAGFPSQLCVWSPTKGGVRQILSGSMDGTFDTMRSRVK
jgi:hypothetical protein